MIRIGINGYGRIGRGLHRQLIDRDDIKVVAINSRAGADSHALLLKRDSVHGTLNADVEVSGNDLVVNGEKVCVFQEAEPSEIPWKECDVDLVIDVTGDPEVEKTLLESHAPHLALVGGASAKFMWQLIEARIRASAEIENTLTRYQSLFRLYVKEEAEGAWKAIKPLLDSKGGQFVGLSTANGGAYMQELIRR